jgi:hypothetical protein
VWRAKYRLPDGRHIQSTIGRVWTERRSESYFAKGTAHPWLRDVPATPSAVVLPGMVRTGEPSPTPPRSTSATSRRTGSASVGVRRALG